MAEQNNSFPTISEKIGGQLEKNSNLHFLLSSLQLTLNRCFRWRTITQLTVM